MKELRDYQVEKANEAHDILSRLLCVYIAGQVRTGKTATSMEVCKLGGFKNVLFLTKKKAIGSIKNDYNDFGFDKYFEITIVNDESMHKLEDVEGYDVIVHDEHHRFGAFPKPGLFTRRFKELFYGKPMIFLSGTPSPESYSQMYHQMWVAVNGPWKGFSNFFKWCRAGYVNVTQKRLGYGTINVYDNANKEKIEADIKPYMVTFTQQDAGFESNVEEEVLTVKMQDATYKLADRLLKDLVIEGKNELILADTPVKLQQKLHQIYSGTIKFESGNRMVLDYSKVDFIIDRFKNDKIAIFYKFTAEYTALKDRLGDKLTDSIEEFNDCDEKWIALQVVSGREGTNLSKADYLIQYNIDFSATSYWQSRDRMTVMDRKQNKVFWIFSDGGIENKIMKAVKAKKKYTVSVFKKDYRVK